MTDFSKYENTYHHYGACPSCGQACQPENVNYKDISLEYVVCCDCRIVWYLHHADPSDLRDGTEPWRDYRISGIESF